MSLTLFAVFGVFQLILFVMHAVIFKTLVVSFGWQWPWLKWLFVVLSITFVSSSALSFRFDNAFVKWYYRISAYWFGLVIFLWVGAFAAYFVENILYTSNFYVAPAIVGSICLGLPFLTHIYATWQTTRIKFTRFDISPAADGIAWPTFWRGKKIIFVSDIHLGAVRSEGFARKVAAAIIAELPDMVLIGGDIFDGVKCHAPSLLEPFSALHPPQGIFFVTGNHEYIEDTPMMLREVEDLGVKILKNEVVDVRGIQIAGVDWKDTDRKDKLEKILATMHIDRMKPSIFLRHEPSYLDLIERTGVSLSLSGHTHAGQIFPLRIIVRRMYQGFEYGLGRFGNMMVCTSSGVGTWGPPLRFGTKTEIVAITLR